MLNISAFLISLILLVNVQDIYVQNTYPDVATYIWHTENIVEETDTYLDFSSGNRVTDIYLQLNRNVEVHDYANFITKAHDKNIQVHLLDGGPHWATSSGEKELHSMLNWLSSYTANVNNTAHFDGIHLDIEFYLMALEDDEEEAAIRQYMERIQTADTYCNSRDLQLSTSIPFWFDKIKLDNIPGYDNLSEWNIATADNTVIMAYRNTMYGANAILTLIKDELVYACQNNSSISIGLETVASEEGDYLSFYDKPKTSLQYVLKALPFSTVFSRGVKGYAVHHLDAWIELFTN